jgi:hypothetical protein
MRMRHQVIEELFCFEHGILCAFGLFAGNCAEHHEDCEVNGKCVVKYAPDQLLGMLYVFVGQR